MKFLKGLGMGVVYFLISPFIIAGSVLYMLYGLGKWFVLVPVGIIRFFKGDKFFKPLKADLEVESAKALYHEQLVEKEVEETKPEPQQVSNSTTTYVQNNYYTNPNPNPNFNQFNNNQLNNPYNQSFNQQQLNGPQYQELQNPQYNQLGNNQPIDNQSDRPLIDNQVIEEKKEGDGE